MRPSSLRELIARASERLASAGVASPSNDARLIAAHLLDVAPLKVGFVAPYAGFESDYAQAIARRARREPLQHITGTAAFGPLELAVGEGVFIPRPETELLAQWARQFLARVAAPATVVDLGTGSGALAIYIATQVPDARVIAVERSTTAIEYARRNADTNGASIRIVHGDMTDPQLLRECDGCVDLIVSNPPYVPETSDVEREVHRDPYEAVFSGVDGMEAIRGLVPVVARLLRSGGAVGIEHDEANAALVADTLQKNGNFSDTRVMKDLAGAERFVTASKLPLCPQPPTTA